MESGFDNNMKNAITEYTFPNLNIEHTIQKPLVWQELMSGTPFLQSCFGQRPITTLDLVK